MMTWHTTGLFVVISLKNYRLLRVSIMSGGREIVLQYKNQLMADVLQ